MIRLFSTTINRAVCRGKNQLLQLARPFGSGDSKKEYSREKREKFASILPAEKQTEAAEELDDEGAINLEKETNFSAKEVALADGQWELLENSGALEEFVQACMSDPQMSSLISRTVIGDSESNGSRC